MVAVSINLDQFTYDTSAILANKAFTEPLTGFLINMTASAEVLNRMFQIYTVDPSVNIGNINNVYFQTFDVSNNIYPFSDISSNYLIRGDNSNLSANGASNRGTLGEDYLDYLSLQIFNTPDGADLFINANDVITQLNDKATEDLGNVIQTCVLDGSLNYQVTGSNGKVSPSQSILFEISKNDPGRLNNFIPVTTREEGWYFNKLTTGDIINFNIIVHANPSQTTFDNQPIPQAKYLAKITLA